MQAPHAASVGKGIEGAWLILRRLRGSGMAADAIVHQTMSEGDAIRRLAVVAALVLCVVLLPMLLKRRVRTPSS